MHDAVVNAAREFASKSLLARRTMTINTEAKTETYPVSVQQEEEILTPISVQGQRLVCASSMNPWDLSAGDPAYWNSAISPGPPYQYCFLPYTSLSLWPVPDTIYKITAVVAVQPRQGASVIADELMREYDQAIAAGALAMLVTVPNRPWSNPAAAPGYNAAFMAGISNARQAVIRRMNAGNLRSRPRPFIV